MCPLETKKQLADGLRRRRYEHLDALYYMRPKKNNLSRIADDYRQEVRKPRLFAPDQRGGFDPHDI